MALKKSAKEDLFEIVGIHRHIQIRTLVLVEEDGNELSRSFYRRSLTPGILGDDDSLIETDLSEESVEVKGIAGVLWTSELKESWRRKLIVDKDFMPDK